MFNLSAMQIESEYQKQQFQQEVHNRRLVRAVKAAVRRGDKRQRSFSLNLFRSRSKEERYTSVAQRRALNSP